MAVETLDKQDIEKLATYTCETKKFSLNGHKTYAKCVHVYDGDTMHAIFKLPNTNEFYKWDVRLNGIDTPEMKSKNNAEKEKAVEARDFLASKILDKIIVLECLYFDKYGRLLANIYLDDVNNSVNQMMIDNGFAKQYSGGTKEGWNELELEK